MDFAAGVFTVWGPLPSYDPILPYTMYTCMQYTYSQKDGGEELTREEVRGAIVHKGSRK